MKGAARALVQQLNAEKVEDREKAAAALQAMGKNAGKALAEHISTYPGQPSATKAITVLARIGSDVADDCKVRTALLSAADSSGTDQFRLAAVDALGEINKYRGIQFSGDDDDPIEYFDATEVRDASKALAKTANELFKELLGTRYDDVETATAAAPTVVVCGPTPRPTPTPTPTPTPSPTPTPIPRDTDFYAKISILQKAQPKLLELAAQASATASSPKEDAAEPTFTKLADAKSLADSLKKIEVAYLNATKPPFAKKAADQADDKSHWQLRTEAAYDLLSETTQLADEVNEASDFADGAPNLKMLLSTLAKISAKDLKLQPAVASAINKIFSQPPKKKPASGEAKKDAKKDEEKKDADKKADATAKDADKAKSKAE